MSEFWKAKGPTRQPALPITYWFPAWWGISPWASPFWTAVATPLPTQQEGPA